MDDTNTETIELTRGEAREIINALSTHLPTVSGQDEDRAFHVREFLQREFEFEERDDGTDDVITETLTDIFGDDDDTREIQLSRAEAAEVDSALANRRGDSTREEAETVESLRTRLRETFDLDTGAV